MEGIPMATKAELEQRIKELEDEIRELKQQRQPLKNERGAGRKKTTTDEMEIEIERLYNTGTSMDKLAKQFKVSKGTIFKIVHWQNV